VVGGMRPSKSVDVFFKYKALVLTFGRGRESRSWNQLKNAELLKEGKRKEISSLYQEKSICSNW
jgi:hypothetical protein